MTKETVSQIIESSLASLDLTGINRLSESNWKIVFNQVEVQLAVEDVTGQPSVSLYFVVLQLPEFHKGACLEELMTAHFHSQSKYALFNNMILQVVEIYHTNFITSDHFTELLKGYTQHVALLRNDLYSRYYMDNQN